MFSRVEVQPSQGRLIVDCRDAPASAADLRDPACLAAVLSHLEREFGIENVVLSHYVEKQYGPKTTGVLRRILALASLLDRLGSRAPSPNFPTLSRKQVAAKCGACPFNPKTLFGRLRTKLMGNFAEFHAAFAQDGEKLYRYRDPGCRACTGATTADLIYLYREVRDFGEVAVGAAPLEVVE